MIRLLRSAVPCALVLGAWDAAEAPVVALLRSGFSVCLLGAWDDIDRDEHPVLDRAEAEGRAFVLSRSLYEIAGNPELALAEASDKVGSVDRVLLTDWNAIRLRSAAGAWLSSLHAAGGGELVVLHSDQNLAWTLRWRHERAADSVRVRAVVAQSGLLIAARQRFAPTTLTGALVSMGFRRVTIQQVDHLAAERVASGADLLAKRLWTDVGGSLAGSPGFCSPEAAGAWLRAGELKPGDAAKARHDGVYDYTAIEMPFVATDQTCDMPCWYVQEVLAEGPVDAIRLSGGGDIFDYDGSWLAVAELDLSSGRVLVCDADSPEAWDWEWSDFNDYHCERWPIDIEVQPGRYVVESWPADGHGDEDLPGLRVRLQK